VASTQRRGQDWSEGDVSQGFSSSSAQKSVDESDDGEDREEGSGI
jgi:hypothetical protein